MQRFTAACAQFACMPMDAAVTRTRPLPGRGALSTRPARSSSCCRRRVTTGFVPTSGRRARWDLVDAWPGRLAAPLQGVAQELGIYLVAGTYEQGAERGVVYNSAAMLGPNGDVLGVYRKRTSSLPKPAAGPRRARSRS